jgi:ketol-acid reductoisomerase
LVKNGYQPEIAYFECLHELKLIVDLIQKGGMMHMWTSVSNTAEYGGLSRRDKIITADTRKAMDDMLKDIQSGKFAKEWMKDAKSGMKGINKMEKAEAESNIEIVGKEIRSLFEVKAPAKVAEKKVVAKVAVKKTPVKKSLVEKAPAKKAPTKKVAAKVAVKKPAVKKTSKK